MAGRILSTSMQPNVTVLVHLLDLPWIQYEYVGLGWMSRGAFGRLNGERDSRGGDYQPADIGWGVSDSVDG